MSEIVCRACGFTGPVEEYDPCLSVYQDICCPQCQSTNNDHNDEYQSRLLASMNKIEEKK